MTGALAKLSKGWSFRSRCMCVDALHVAQGRTLPFLGEM
jgi:hypothetical protein